MTDLTGKQIANTYKQLLKVAVSTNSGVSTTAQTIQSGDGTNSAMQLSTTAIKFANKNYDPLLNSLGNIKQSVDVQSNKLTITATDLDLI